MSLLAVQKTFEHLGRTDPLWAVLTHREYKNNRWDPAQFFETGRIEIQRIIDYLDKQSPGHRRAHALDFGCGVGRLSQALCQHFDCVTGVDISSTMLDVAKRHNKFQKECRYVLNCRRDLSLFVNDSFDFIYSNITLQHMAPEFAKAYIAEFIRVLRPTGVAIFQLPSNRIEPDSRIRKNVRRFRNQVIRPIWKKIRFKPIIEMHGIPRDEVLQFVDCQGGRTIDVVDDFSAGTGWLSYRFCVAPKT